MPWKETDAMSQRVAMLRDFQSGDYTISDLAQMYAVSRKTVYKWIGRYDQEGWNGLTERTRKPHHSPSAVSKNIEATILEWKGKHPSWGAPKIHRKIRDLEGAPCISTVGNVLKRSGLTRSRKKRARAVPSYGPLAHAQNANDVWCADFKGHFFTGNGRRCDPLTISDASSRYLLRCQGLGHGTGFLMVKPHFVSTFREYGLPNSIRTDNGPPFANRGMGGLSRLAIWWLRLGIRLERILPGKPQQNGRHERLHLTLKNETIHPPQETLTAQQKAFDAFLEEYNHDRPHEALNQETPASCYQASFRDYPEQLPPPKSYPESWRKRRVIDGGNIWWKSRRIYIARSLTDDYVGLRKIDEDKWSIHYQDLELGQIEGKGNRIIKWPTLKWVALEEIND